MNYRFLICLECFLWLLNACSVSTISVSQSASQCYTLSDTSTTTPRSPIPTIAIQSSGDGSVWQPPAPVYSDYTYPPSPPLPPFLVKYEIINPFVGGSVGITAESVAYALTNDGQELGRLHLSPHDMDGLLAQITAIDPKDVVHDFIEKDNTTGDREQKYRTITVATSTQFFTVTLQGDPVIPQSLSTFETSLVAISDRAYTCKPALIMG